MEKGFSHKPIFDFQDPFTRVVKAPTIRIILTLALTHKWLLIHVDVNNAVFHGDVYMTQPHGFKQCDEHGRVLVCRLNKALYGLKQAPRVWFKRFKHFFCLIPFSLLLLLEIVSCS